MRANVWWLLRFSYFDFSASCKRCAGKPRNFSIFPALQEWSNLVTAASSALGWPSLPVTRSRPLRRRIPSRLSAGCANGFDLVDVAMRLVGDLFRRSPTFRSGSI